MPLGDFSEGGHIEKGYKEPAFPETADSWNQDGISVSNRGKLFKVKKVC
jgi:hypothetical protein